jgi:hypothetical protein
VSGLTFALPAALCAGLWLAPAGSPLGFAVLALAALAWMALLGLVNWWEFTSLWLRWAWLAALLAGGVVRVAAGPPWGGAHPFGAGTWVAAILGAGGLWLVAGALRARRPAGARVELTFPLRRGCFLVTDGGDGARSFLVNYHFAFGRHRASGVSAAMRYAMDVVEIGSLGGESFGLFPNRNEGYRIWERPLLAPCDGVVAHVTSDVPDNTAFGHDRPYGVGNHVVIRSGVDVYVTLGHLRRGSVRVAAGQEVRAGDLLGRVGNSGWTERPHLHMQAARAPDGDWWHGEPLAMLFDGRFLVRNQRLRT